ETLPGVHVLEKGTTNGTIVSGTGKYSITVEENATLVFSMLGFTSKEVQVKTSREVNVQLLEDVKGLSEVMVVGYGSKNKSTFAGSAVTLAAEDLNKSSLSMANLLQGRAAGVQISQ